MNFNLNSEEIQAIQNTYVTQAAPMMSHQTSQQTVTQHHHHYDSSPVMNYMPTFDLDDEMEVKSPLAVDHPRSFHVSSRPHKADLLSQHLIPNSRTVGSLNEFPDY
jgi:hypothetical protein